MQRETGTGPSSYTENTACSRLLGRDVTAPVTTKNIFFKSGIQLSRLSEELFVYPY